MVPCNYLSKIVLLENYYLALFWNHENIYIMPNAFKSLPIKSLLLLLKCSYETATY